MKVPLEQALNGGETVALCWNVILAFLRVATKPGLFRNPLTPEGAFDLVAAWLERPVVTVIDPGPKHFTILRALLAPLGTAGNLTSDAHLAALAIEHGAQLCSCDADFARFPGLHWQNPLP
jgi:toxin-antitoxin system PIN domain toxin